VTDALAAGLRDEAAAFGDTRLPATGELGYGQLLAAAGGDDAPRLALAVELVYEGYLAHYRESRVLPDDVSEESRLLAGDYLYAHGLRTLAATGDVGAVEVLTRLMASCSFVRVEGLPMSVDDDLWETAVLAVAASPDSGVRSAATEGFVHIAAAIERHDDDRLPELARRALAAVRRAGRDTGGTATGSPSVPGRAE